MEKDEPKKTVWTIAKVEEIQRLIALSNIASLDAPIGNSYENILDATLGDLIEDTAPSPEELAIKGENKNYLLKVIELALSPREVTVIKMRFGFNDGFPMTLEEVGSHFGITRERIRQIEAKALMKIRRYMKRHELYQRDDWDVE